MAALTKDALESAIRDHLGQIVAEGTVVSKDGKHGTLVFSAGGPYLAVTVTELNLAPAPKKRGQS